MIATMAKTAAFPGNPFDGIAQRSLIDPLRLISHHRRIQIESRTRPTLAHLMRRHQMSHRLPLGIGRHRFFVFTSRGVALSNNCSADTAQNRRRLRGSGQGSYLPIAAASNSPSSLAFEEMPVIFVGVFPEEG